MFAIWFFFDSGRASPFILPLLFENYVSFWFLLRCLFCVEGKSFNVKNLLTRNDTLILIKYYDVNMELF